MKGDDNLVPMSLFTVSEVIFTFTPLLTQHVSAQQGRLLICRIFQLFFFIFCVFFEKGFFFPFLWFKNSPKKCILGIQSWGVSKPSFVPHTMKPRRKRSLLWRRLVCLRFPQQYGAGVPDLLRIALSSPAVPAASCGLAEAKICSIALMLITGMGRRGYNLVLLLFQVPYSPCLFFP